MGRSAICGIISLSGPNGEPLACAYPPGHEGAHSWATLPMLATGGEHRHRWHPAGFVPHPASGEPMPCDRCACGAVLYPYPLGVGH